MEGAQRVILIVGVVRVNGNVERGGIDEVSKEDCYY